MLLGNQLVEKLNGDLQSPFPFLAYLEDIKIGPQKSEDDILIEFNLHQDVTSMMTIDELRDQVVHFTKLVYARFPRFSTAFRVIIRRVTMQQIKARYIIIIKYN